MDFRGGDRRINPYMAEYIKNVNEGKTEWQRRRELLQKVALYGAQAGLTGIAGGLSAADSNEKQRKLDEKNSEEYAETPPHDYAGSKAPDREKDMPAWLGQHGEGDTSVRDLDKFHNSAADASPYAGLPTDALATQAAANSQLNDAARDAAIGSWYTKPGLEKHAMTSSQLADDTGVAMDEMKMGGMQNSLPRVPR